MKHMPRIAPLALASLLALTGCAQTGPAPAATTPATSATAEATPEVDEDEPSAVGSRQNPVPYGEAFTFLDAGGAGDAWKVTIDVPRDMSTEILNAAIAMYGDDPSYTAHARPEPGTTFFGYTGTLERLLDTPGDPGADLALAIVGTDGNTYDALVAGVSAPEEMIYNISDMYAPATARFADVQVMPEGVTAAQVLVTARSTGQAIYFGAAS